MSLYLEYPVGSHMCFEKKICNTIWSAVCGGLNAVQFFMGKKRDNAAIALIDAQTLSTLIQATKMADDRANAAWRRCDLLDKKLDDCEKRSDICDKRATALESEVRLLKEKLAEAGT